MTLPDFAHDLPELRDRRHVFRDRRHAGTILASMLGAHRGGDALVLGVPRGGVEVAAVVAEALELPLDVLVASKIAPPWNAEYGYGVVAYDGTVVVDREVAARLELDEADIAEGIERAREKVAKRSEELREGRSLPSLVGRKVIVVDDGIATGATVLGAVKAARNAGAREVILAVPTAHSESLEQFRGLVSELHVPNVRSGFSFGVSQSLEGWGDTDVDEVRSLLRAASERPPAPHA